MQLSASFKFCLPMALACLASCRPAADPIPSRASSHAPIAEFAVLRPEIQDAFGRATETQLQLLERWIGFSLPDAYRGFLARTNGGSLAPTTVIRLDDGSESDVFILYAIEPGFAGDYADILKIRQQTDLPPEYLAVGHTACGDRFSVHLPTGQVHLWLSWLEHPEEEVAKNPVFVADDFDDFVARMEIDERSDDPHPLFRAIEQWEPVDPVELLRAARNDERNQHGWTVLMMASNRSRLDIVDLLLKNRIDVAAVDSKGKTSLHFAIAGHSLDGTRLLLEAGSGVEAADQDGYTPLLYAARKYSLRIAEYLIERGANTAAKTHQNEDILQIMRGANTPRSDVEWIKERIENQKK